MSNRTANDHDLPGSPEPLPHDLPPLAFGVTVPITEDEPTEETQ